MQLVRTLSPCPALFGTYFLRVPCGILTSKMTLHPIILFQKRYKERVFRKYTSARVPSASITSRGLIGSPKLRCPLSLSPSNILLGLIGRRSRNRQKPLLLSFMETDWSLELMSQLEKLDVPVMEIPGFGSMCYSNDTYSSNRAELCCMPFPDHSSGLLPMECLMATALPQSLASISEQSQGDRKRRRTMEATEASNDHSSAACSWTGFTQVKTVVKNKNFMHRSSGSRKGGRRSSKEVQKPKEVVHVRARRGQATDSHSLAERVRREKINERMRCLQDLVPGCYKTMGMAGMLDEIINYVQSLQKQVEFLSMKLSGASFVYDYCLDTDSVLASKVVTL